VSPAFEEIVFVQDLGSLSLRVGTQIDKFVPVQISVQSTQALACETDPAARANLVSIHGLSEGY